MGTRVPFDRQRLERGLGLPPTVGDDRDGIVHYYRSCPNVRIFALRHRRIKADLGPFDLDDHRVPLHALDAALIDAAQLSAEGGALTNGRKTHARQFEVNAVNFLTANCGVHVAARDCLADLQQTAAAWAAEGVQTMDGTPLPPLTDSTLVLPAGARGPAFLVGPNFRTLLRYNNSTSYALGVGLLAQQLAGGAAVQTPWPRDLQALTRSQLLALQAALNARGFDSGTPDGTMGPATRSGVRAYQRSLNLPADGYPTLELLERLQ